MSENNNHSDDQKYGEEYNQYVLNDGIWAKLDAKVNADILDRFYAKARKKIRQRGGLLSTQDALELVMKEDKQEIINDILQELRKEGCYYPLIADAFQDEKTREDAMRVLESMIEELESFD